MQLTVIIYRNRYCDIMARAGSRPAQQAHQDSMESVDPSTARFKTRFLNSGSEHERLWIAAKAQARLRLFFARSTAIMPPCLVVVV